MSKPFRYGALCTAILFTTLALGQPKSGGGGGGGGGAPAAASSGGGGGSSATGEQMARMYRAISLAAHDVARQLKKDGKIPTTVIIYDPRIESDVATYLAFKPDFDFLDGYAGDRAALNVENFNLDLTGVLHGVSLPGVIATLGSIGGISATNFTPTISYAGVAGPSDAEAFLANRIVRELRAVVPADPGLKVFEPGVFPITSTGNPDLLGGSLDPVTKLYDDYGNLLQKTIKNDGLLIAPISEKFQSDTHVLSAGLKDDSLTAYVVLIGDLKGAIGWNTGAGMSPPTAGGASSPPPLPLSTIVADIAALRAKLPPGPRNDWNGHLVELQEKVVKNPLDEDIRLKQAMEAAFTSLNAPVAAYGNVSSGSPGAAAPDTLANIIIRGWHVQEMLREPSAKLLRVRLEAAQGTDYARQYLWFYSKKASAMAQVSFTLFDGDGQVDDTGSSLVYFDLNDSAHSMSDTANSVQDGNGVTSH